MSSVGPEASSDRRHTPIVCPTGSKQRQTTHPDRLSHPEASSDRRHTPIVCPTGSEQRQTTHPDRLSYRKQAATDDTPRSSVPPEASSDGRHTPIVCPTGSKQRQTTHPDRLSHLWCTVEADVCGSLRRSRSAADFYPVCLSLF